MYRHRCLLLGILFFGFCLRTAYFQFVVVSTDLGNITGTVEDSLMYDEDGNTVSVEYVQYLGIPYAEPPVGELRFAKPVAKQPWKGTHNGTVYGPMCHQGNGQVPTGPSALVGVEMSEACLTLDIYVPYNTTSDGSYAVIIYLFGTTGASRGFIGDALSVRGEVIVVVINFRTHLMGFFSLGDTVAPGNYGLWDQKLALYWVKNHIENFGGDPDRISLIGFSMGGSNAILQALHAGNEGVIKRVVALSGTPFPTFKNSSYLKETRNDDFLENVKCARETSADILTCLRSKTIEEINSALASLPYVITFTPVVDGDFLIADPQTIVTDNRTELIESRDAFGSIDLMLGLTNKEGGTHVALMWSDLLKQDKDIFVVTETDFENVIVPTSMVLLFGDNVPQAILENVVFQYLPKGASRNLTDLRNTVVDLSTDIDVATPIIKTAMYHSQLRSNGTLLYQFSANLSLQKPLTPTWLEGANHGDDVYFLFGFSQRNMDAWEQTKGFVPTSSEITTSQKWITIIANFVKSGQPFVPVGLQDGIEWLAYNEATSPYMDISHTAILSSQYFREPQMTFWTKIVPDLLQLLEMYARNATCIVQCEENVELGHYFKIDINLAENILVSFIIMTACLMLALLLICSLSIANNNSTVYKLQSSSSQFS